MARVWPFNMRAGLYWSSLGGLKGVMPPEAFGERSPDWSLGHAGDEGPHLSMTGESRGCSRAAAPVCGFRSSSPVGRLVTLLGVTLPVVYHFLVAAAAKSRQSCPTLCDPIDSSPTGSPVPGSLQARPLEWVATSFSSA